MDGEERPTASAEAGDGDALAARNRQLMLDAMDALTEEILRDYIQNHLLSRGAPVGRA